MKRHRPADPIFAASETHLPNGRFIADQAYFGLSQAGRDALKVSPEHSRKQGFMSEFASCGER
jgi:hypothetical protein